MFTLHIGYHRGTLTSRDSESRKFETKEEAIKSYTASKDFWRSIGYMVWFSYITDENGDRVWTGDSNAYK